MQHRKGRLKEVYEQKTALSNSKTSIDAQLKTAKTSFVNLVHSESLKGDVKEAINAKITNHQVPLLTNFTNALAVLLAQYEKTIKQFQSTVSENAVDAIIDTEYLQGLLDGFSDLETNISTVDKATATIYSSISDIISLTNPDASTITTPLSEGKKILTDTKTNMASFNGWKRGDEYSKLLQVQTSALKGLETAGKSSFTSKEAKAFYNNNEFLGGVLQVVEGVNNSTPVELLNLVSKSVSMSVEGYHFVKKTSKKIADNENYNRFNNGMDLIGGFYDLFVGGARSHLSHNSMERSGFEGLSKFWQMYSKDGKTLRDVLNNSRLGSKFRSGLSAINNSKLWQFASKLKDTVNVIDGPLKSGINVFGKGLNFAGWTVMAAEATYHGVSAYNDKDSRAYKSVGKSVIHAGIETMKNAGPLEATALGAQAAGPVGAAIGFGYGTFNTLLGVIDPKLKDKLYEKAESLAFDAYDGAAKAVGDVGKAVSSGWKTMTSWFGG